MMFGELWHDEEGMTTVEYALMLMLVVVVSAAAWAGLGSRASHTVTKSNTTLPN